MRAISLFSGVGGFELGFDRAGIQTVLQVEQDPVCLSVLERHWPETERLTDVRSLGGSRERPLRDTAQRSGFLDYDWRRQARTGLSDGVGEPVSRGRGIATDGVLREASRQQRYQQGATESIDLVYGGFPCQDVSVAGQRTGLSGNRSSLWFEFERILSELRPRWCVIENVPGLLSSNDGRDFARILMGLGELGYGWAYRVLDARWFGVPQRRRRVFVVGCLGGQARAQAVLAVCESCGGHPPTRGAEGQDVAFTLAGGSPETSRRIGNAWNMTYLPALYEADPEGVYALRSDASRDGEARTPSADAEGNVRLRDPGFNVYREAPTLDGTAPHSVAYSAGVRRLTPRECNRLQGFPDDWDRYGADGKEIADSHRYRCMGNAVCVPVAEWLGHRLVAVDGGA